ncbi:hypothetical protein C4901_10045 [Acidiferrobacter sp. SPIII_3]|jgi:hypothetical protein|uniref:hypothetical protein n=1 Tax=Acidiferrobacter sp. SPIII_3 TaxID=1281578 RepID=UPI000D730DF0|nr:hypothetical protein [Acidiferrobacter sp. SPIII_3]AWP23626.1 hypothetical protein C4901_10045 [Acidiferrobacter sp. SPIII_3]
MDLAFWVLAGLFAPLFPLSWLFNRLVASLPAGIAQGLAVLVLPQVGIELLRLAPQGPLCPAGLRHWVMALATASALLYAVRALSARELGIWTRFVLSSGLATVWLAWAVGAPTQVLRLMALGWGLPAAVALYLTGILVRRVGGAYMGLHGGLVAVMPRMTASLVFAVLALTVTPVFPAFFMLWRGLGSIPVAWMPFWLPLIFLWGWAAGRLFQDLLFGDYRGEPVVDIGGMSVALIGIVFLASLVVSLVGGGGASWH